MSTRTASRVRVPGARRRTTALALLLLLLAPAIAAAHVSLTATTPERNATVAHAPPELRLRFSGRIESRYTSLTLLAPDGGEVPLGAVTFVDGSDREFTAAMPPVRLPGTYTVQWRTAGADGHVLEGTWTFTLARDTAADLAPADAPAVAPPPAQPADDATHHQADDDGTGFDAPAVFARWVHFAALLLLTGAFAFRALLLPRLPFHEAMRAELKRVAWRGLAGAALLLGVAAVLRLWVQSAALHGADRAWDFSLLSILVTDTRWGRAWLVQAFFFALLGAAISMARPARDRAALALAAPAVVGLATIPALTGHAAGARGAAAVVLNDALHVLAAGAWLGTLALVLLAAVPLLLRRSRSAGPDAAATIERFSPLALAATGLVVLTGAINGLLHLRSPADLTGTGYGRALLVKIGLFLLVAAAGFINWRVVRPALTAGGSPRRLRMSVGVELGLALLVLLATAVLTGLPRP